MTDSFSCDPCHRLPKRLSCCDCMYLVKIGCLPTCAISGQMIPFPNLTVCGSCTLVNRGHGELCRRCCGDDDGCKTGVSDTGNSGCCNNGINVNSCKGPDEPPEKSQIWCHMRTGILASDHHGTGLCRRCCMPDQDGCSGELPDTSCKSCRTIQQRMNF